MKPPACAAGCCSSSGVRRYLGRGDGEFLMAGRGSLCRPCIARKAELVTSAETVGSAAGAAANRAATRSGSGSGRSCAARPEAGKVAVLGSCNSCQLWMPAGVAKAASGGVAGKTGAAPALLLRLPCWDLRDVRDVWKELRRSCSLLRLPSCPCCWLCAIVAARAVSKLILIAVLRQDVERTPLSAY